MSATPQGRPAGRRLVAVRTAGLLSLGAFALGTGAQAAEPGGHRFTPSTRAEQPLPKLDRRTAPDRRAARPHTTTPGATAAAPASPACSSATRQATSTASRPASPN